MKKSSIQKNIRIVIESQRYEVATSLFAPNFPPMGGEAVGDSALVRVSSEEEVGMGILSDGLWDDPETAYFVKPADPAVLRAKAKGEDTEAIEKMELVTEGIMTVTLDTGFTEEPSRTVTIFYDETELTGMEGARTTISYRTQDPGLVTMVRSGSVSTAMTFKAHHRAICTYETPYMPFFIGVHALVVDNRLDTEGLLRLDYIMEFRGAKAERCDMTVRIFELS